MVQAGFVGFLPDDHQEIWTFLEGCAKIGFTAMDMDVSYVVPEGDFRENTKRVRDLGIEPLTLGCGCDFDAALKELPRKIELAHIQGIHRITSYSSSISKSIRLGYGVNGTYDEMMHDFEGMSRLVEACEREGISYCYHNHYHEFSTYYNGVTAFDHMLYNVDPRLKFDLDVGWVTSGRFDPVQVLKRLEGRVPCVHMKDFYDLKKPWKMREDDPASKEGFTSLGTGLVNVPGIMEELNRQKVGYACVEQDIMRNLDRMEALEMAYYSMKESGFVAAKE